MYSKGEGVLASDTGNRHLDDWNWLIKLAKVLRWLRSQQHTSTAPQTVISLSELCCPSPWAPASFWMGEERPWVMPCCGWGAAWASSKLQKRAKCKEIEKPQCERSRTFKRSRRMAENLWVLHHTVSSQGFGFLLLEEKQNYPKDALPGGWTLQQGIFKIPSLCLLKPPFLVQLILQDKHLLPPPESPHQLRAELGAQVQHCLVHLFTFWQELGLSQTPFNLT